MEDDYVCVLLKSDKKKMVIPRKWWQMNRAHNIRVVRFGVRPWQIQKIFYGPDKNELPNFNLANAQKFNEHKRNCYSAHVLNIFGENELFFYISRSDYIIFSILLADEDQAERYIAARRSLKPVNYDLNKKMRKRRSTGVNKRKPKRQPTALPSIITNRHDENRVEQANRQASLSTSVISAKNKPSKKIPERAKNFSKAIANARAMKRKLIGLKKKIRKTSIQLRKKIRASKQHDRRCNMNSVKMEEMELLRKANRILNRRGGVEVIDDNEERQKPRNKIINEPKQNQVCESISQQVQLANKINRMQPAVAKKVDTEFSGYLEYHEVF